ncbi:hypothetical protein DPMN_151309 [Dreissena polymorpha]|uniref:Uncharacterized protein n=1 Tax=Dreissena polymorpha TaxID=45954 RepID=A0A9D4FF23_DREPO|nr:hypothetical protein DPMN_151309 [Dreissena polymorpha]
MSLILRVITCMAVLILLCGDVETNPGPPKQDGTRNKSQYKRAAGTQDLGDQNGERPTPRRTIQEGVATRQRTLSSYATCTPQQSPGSSTQTNNDNLQQNHRQQDQSKSNNESDMFAFLRNMKIDIGNQNERLINNIEGINSKIDQLFTSVNNLKHDNERLRQDNEHLREEMHFMKQKLDRIENQSRRNNLRFNGINGSL